MNFIQTYNFSKHYILNPNQNHMTFLLPYHLRFTISQSAGSKFILRLKIP